MVYGICYCVKKEDEILKKLGCADSKSLTEEKREVIFKNMCQETSNLGWAVDVISPNQISNCMLRRYGCPFILLSSLLRVYNYSYLFSNSLLQAEVLTE